MNSQAHEEGQLQIGNYQLGRTVGEGTFGKVKTAVHLPTGQLVAVKIIVKDKIADVHDVERVARQLHILRIVRHPSIVQLYQIIETKNYLFIMTEYFQNGQLYEFIVKKGHLQEDEACVYFQQLIAGLKYMKSLGICHRDLKPQNLLLDHNHTLKIIDFGLSNTYHEGQTLKTACGSPCYAAPQMLAGKKYNGAAVDIWSCGIVLFAMVCGYLPFEDSNTRTLYQKIEAGKLDYPSRVSPQFVDLIRKLLQPNPERRIAIQQIEEHPWFQLVECILPTKGIKVGLQPIQADTKVLKEMQVIGFDLNHSRMSVEANRHGPDYAGYYLQLKKMRCQGYQSQHDINSVCFRYTVPPDSDPKESFENTRKSYYFGVHEHSSKKANLKQAHSLKTGKQSPSKSEVSMHRKKKVKLPQQAIYSTSFKIPRSVNKKKLKRKMYLHSECKKKTQKQLKSYLTSDSPAKIACYRTAARRIEHLSSGKKQIDRWKDRKNRSCSLIQRYS